MDKRMVLFWFKEIVKTHVTICAYWKLDRKVENLEWDFAFDAFIALADD